VSVKECHQATRITIRQWSKQHAVHDRKDRGRRADAERQGQNRHCSERGLPPQEPPRMSQIPDGRRPRRQPQGLCPNIGCRRNDVPEIAAAHFGGRQAACHVVVEGVVEVTQDERRLGAADEQGREEPPEARPA
jgi:hypothetical protein